MHKIQTIFDRDWSTKQHKVIDKYIDSFKVGFLVGAKATEKLDGMNVRVTIRNYTCVRLEKRRNPDKLQKSKGILEPWYKDADECGAEDKWLFDALKNTDLKIMDGEWSGEAIGPNIQGNPLKLEFNRIVFFSLNQAPIFENVPITYQELKEWLPKQKSKYGNNCGIEGIVWHCLDGAMYKIKLKDF